MDGEGQSGVRGFLFSAVSCGLKRKEDELDLALIFSQSPATVAGVFTRNLVAAAPVVLDRERLARGVSRGILANAGCANACTGPEGYQDALETARCAAQELGVNPEEIMVASTGVIGTRLPLDRIRRGIPALVQGLGPERLGDVARAIMTTDTRPKWTHRRTVLGGAEVRMAAVVKGAGMIHPQMATMLCFVATDAAVSPGFLQSCLEGSLGRSFHAITVDGDTSTNDTVLVLANGLSGGASIREGSREGRVFQELLGDVLEEMALAVVGDAEGATKLVHVEVEGATDDRCADRVARAIAHSPLVKTAFYGQEVNWGRIVAAAGYSGVRLEPERMDLWYGQVQVLKGGRPLGEEMESLARDVARQKEFKIRICLGMGPGRALIHTCDLSHDYVTINGSYRS
jgi:glutamate N-acetyltransferase/amino-acid N-acetyltransferase